MAQLGTFDPDAVQDEERELLPPGMYTAQVIESDLVAAKTGSGQMLNLTFEIIDGACAKRRVLDNLNIQNRNAQAQEIAQRALKRLCAAVGHVGVLTDSEQLHFKPLRIRVAVREDKTAQYGPKNEVKAYEALGGRPSGGFSQASAPSSAAQPQEQQRAAGGGSRPWK
jgi:hypothetical protein